MNNVHVVGRKCEKTAKMRDRVEDEPIGQIAIPMRIARATMDEEQHANVRKLNGTAIDEPIRIWILLLKG